MPHAPRPRALPWLLATGCALCAGDGRATPLAPLYAPAARAGITRVTGLPLTEPVRFRRVKVAELQELLLPRMAEDLDRIHIDKYSRLVSDLGFLAPSADLRETMLAFLQEQSSGFYLSEEKTFYVVEGGLLQDAQFLTEAVVVTHELVHAAQDQARDTTALLRAVERDDDRSRAISLAYEGQATLVGNRVGSAIAFFPVLGPLALGTGDPSSVLTFAGPVRQVMLLGTGFGRSGQLPRYVREDFLSRYTEGTRFAWTVERAWGQDAHRWLTCRPPESSEQILHPEKYLLDSDRPLDVEVALPDAGPVLAHTNLGEWGLRWLLGQFMPEAVAHAAAAGWGGDRAALFASGVTAWRLVMDTERDAGELAAALSTVYRQRGRGVVRQRGREVHVLVGLDDGAADAASAFLASRWSGPFAPLPPPPPGSPCWDRGRP